MALDLTAPQTLTDQQMALTRIERLDRRLLHRFKDRLTVQPVLTRPLVSFQANKTRAVYRWYKYKEAFSASLIEYFLNRYQLTSGRILDPFAGSGTALFIASENGLDADGIELLPIGQQIIATRQTLQANFTDDDLGVLKDWADMQPWRSITANYTLPELRITKGAYPAATRESIEKFVSAMPQTNERVQGVLRFALLCILESISYTRKDGQYLRWDDRSERRQGARPFDKGPILDFDHAMSDKLAGIVQDLSVESPQLDLFAANLPDGEIRLYTGSCLNLMPTLLAEQYEAIITSPPYCNRYDYTRTYALELAVLGVDEQGVLNLRQQMLSCTVENSAKDLLKINPHWTAAIAATDQQDLLQTILQYLDDQRAAGALNNTGIPRMVRGYFYEMACVIAECARVLKPGAP
ncbi:MAG: site-specific DNA-methyltransferase, partial [Chloroflexi bacterium]|nr:site-specific DNA-methyltransferase [Chloroflexota bacterium]